MSDADLIDATRLVRIIRREKKTILAIFLNIVLIAVVYVNFAPVLYTAKASILLDKTVSTAVGEIATLRRLGFETESILSEVETMKSDQVLDKVIDALGKSEHEKVKELARRDDVRAALVDKIIVSRINETYVMEVMFKHSDPEAAAIIANAFSNAYIEYQLDLKSDMSLRTVEWLKEKLAEINLQIIEKNRNLIEYRVRYNEHQSRNLANGKSDNSLTLKELDRLETETRAYEELYQSYLEKLKSISVQDNFPVTETRVINVAVPPKEQSQPITSLALAAAAVIGVGLGIFIAIIKDVKDATIKRAGQVASELRGDVLGFLPPSRDKAKKRPLSPFIVDEFLGRNSFSEEEIDCFRAILNKTTSGPGRYVLGIVSDISPASSARFVEAFGSFCCLDTSTTIIDGSIDFSGIEENPGPKKSHGTWYINKEAFENATRRIPGFEGFLVKAGSVVGEHEIPQYNKRNVTTAITWAGDENTRVIVNCPPLSNKSEFECYTNALDGVVILLEWGVSRINEAKFLISSLDIDNSKILGFVFVGVDLEKLQKYYGHRRLNSKSIDGRWNE